MRRKNPPLAWEWSIPGGKLRQAEPERDGARRELREETGVQARILRKIDTVAMDGFLLHDYVAVWQAGEPTAADDALAAAFMTPEALASLNMWDVTIDIILRGRDIYELNDSIGPSA